MPPWASGLRLVKVKWIRDGSQDSGIDRGWPGAALTLRDEESQERYVPPGAPTLS